MNIGSLNLFLTLTFLLDASIENNYCWFENKKAKLFVKVIYSRNFVFTSFASCLRKCENSFPRKYLPLKYYYTGEQDSEKDSTIFHFCNSSLNNVFTSTCLLLQNLHSTLNASVSYPTQ